MSPKVTNLSDQEKESLRFLENDFNQCFQHMKYYDSQILEILKFLFSAYTVLITITLGIFQVGIKEGIDLSAPAMGAILAGLILGLFMFALNIRNRVYFVQVARYVNLQRKFFTSLRPMGFENETRMYVNPNQPPYFNWRSSQIWLSYIIAGLNTLLFGILVYIYTKTLSYSCGLVAWSCGVLLATQVMIAIAYLSTRESKSASRAVFGKKD